MVYLTTHSTHLYVVEHGKRLPGEKTHYCYYMGSVFRLAARYILYAKKVHTMAFVIQVVEHWVERYIGSKDPA